MRPVTVHLLKPSKSSDIVYPGELVLADAEHIVVRARWTHAPLDLGYVVFDTNDYFYEYYYFERWYNIFQIHSSTGALKGWYCNVARPARVEGDLIFSEDLEIDLFVSPDRAQMLTLDMDEFEARGFAASEPATEHAARAALGQLKELVRQGAPPFDAV